MGFRRSEIAEGKVESERKKGRDKLERGVRAVP